MDIENESTDTFYFVIYNGKDKSAIKVIDLAYSVDYERSDFPVVNKEDFQELEDAIEHAKALAEKYGLRYIPFESRYDSGLNESCNLSLD